MRKRLVDRIPFAKIMLVLAVALILSIGSCGLSFIFTSSRGASDPLALIGLVGLLCSLAALVLTSLTWAILAIVGSSGEKVSQPQKPFDEKDDTNLDKRE
jgi:hypothetical protein